MEYKWVLANCHVNVKTLNPSMRLYDKNACVVQNRTFKKDGVYLFRFVCYFPVTVHPCTLQFLVESLHTLHLQQGLAWRHQFVLYLKGRGLCQPGP